MEDIKSERDKEIFKYDFNKQQRYPERYTTKWQPHSVIQMQSQK